MFALSLVGTKLLHDILPAALGAREKAGGAVLPCRPFQVDIEDALAVNFARHETLTIRIQRGARKKAGGPAPPCRPFQVDIEDALAVHFVRQESLTIRIQTVESEDVRRLLYRRLGGALHEVPIQGGRRSGKHAARRADATPAMRSRDAQGWRGNRHARLDNWRRAW